MPEHKITVYGTEWCGDCFRTRQFLKNNSILFTFINIDRDKDAEIYVINTNRGMRSVPTVLRWNNIGRAFKRELAAN
jgi:glutaredoxin